MFEPEFRMKISKLQSPISKPRGAALIMTLVLAGMMAMVVIAYLLSMRIELGAASAYEQTQSAKVLTQSALSHGIELLRANIPEPARLSEDASNADAELWVTNPGRLTILQGNGEPRYVDLHTGAVTGEPGSGAERDLDSVDLNRPMAGEEFPPITVALDERGVPDPDTERPKMRVRWHNVLRDPSQPAAKENPIVGRYAFWMDDESGKLNFNVAGGKTAIGKQDDERFHEQLASGLMPPLFTLGGGHIEYNQASMGRDWALGKLRSINLDVLAESPEELDVAGLLEQAWLNGFSRYPEAIMDFVRTGDPVEWYHHRKYNLTFYSRSPEFNVFGKSRLFTTNIPLSLEGGPLYQLPFIHGSGLARPEDGVLHLHSLMGSLGFTHSMKDPEGKKDPDTGKEIQIHASNTVNKAQLEMLMAYLRRPWPGYDKSFVDKYGEKECYQIALGMLLQARMATTTMNTNTKTATGARDWAWRTTSVNYSPPSDERKGNTPERHFWRVEADGKEELMIPQTPGPHITEVRLRFKLVKAGKAAGKYRVNFKHESEFYMHPFGPEIRLDHFPVKVDYLWIEPEGDTPWELGPTDPDSRDPDRNWDHQNSLGRLRATAGAGTVIRPSNAFLGNPDAVPRNRILVGSPARFIGKRDGVVPTEAAQGRIFDLSSEDLTLNFKIRLGMSIRPDPRRPRQMIPMGDTDQDEHVLDGKVELSMFGDREQFVTFSIVDPRLSGLKDAWVRKEDDKGTPGKINPDEPPEESTEKSKFRYISRGGGSIRSVAHKKRRFPLNKPDEFNSRSAVSSIGFWSMLHTGIQSNEPWRTLNLGPSSTQDGDPPDALLLDLLGATYPMQHDQWKIEATLPDQFSTVSFMNSTAGQINLNTRVYPQSPWFEAPERKKPLEAVFKHLRPDEEVDELVDNIVDFQTDDRCFRYIGELAEVDGYERTEGYQNNDGDDEPTQFEKEEILRNMAGCLTTKSNTFSLWGVAQVVTKQRQPGAGASYGEMESGDSVRAEKRFFAIIERYIWPGKDGVPGNGHVSPVGTWDRIARPNGKIPRKEEQKDGTTNVVDRLFDLPGSPPQLPPASGQRLRLNHAGTHPEYDGPEEVGMDPYTARAIGKVKWTKSDLIDAYNPPQPVIKYRVVYFKYLDS